MTTDLGVGGWCVCAMLALWYLLSIFHQVTSRHGDWIKRRNLLALIPAWTFFAPTPGTTDYRLVFRDRQSTGFTGWSEVEWCRPRRLVDAVWHPQRHRTKLVVDCVTAFVRTVQEMGKLGMNVTEQPQSWMISVPYMALFNVTHSMPRTTGASGRQFAVIEVSPSDSTMAPRLVVCSSVHDID